MNVDTPLFRGTLSLVAIWLAVWAYLTYQSYRSDYRDPYGITFAADPEMFAGCYSQTLDFRGADAVWREPTAKEKTDCVNRSLDVHRKLTLDSNERLVWESSEKFLKVGLAPAIAILFVIAFWTSLSRSGVGIARRYANWLRHGTKDITGQDG